MKKLFLLLCLLLLAGSCSNNDTPSVDNPGEKLDIELDVQQRSICEKGNDFAGKLLLQTAEENENVLLAPLSLQVALGMLANGANEEAYNEIVTTLGMVDYSLAELNDYHQKLTTAIADENDPSVELALDNSMWFKEGLSVKNAFKENMSTYYNAPVNSLDFSNTEKAKAKINGWAKEATHSTIKDLQLPLDASTTMVLANASYFNGKWDKPFDKKNTKEGIFYGNDGKDYTAQFMNASFGTDYAETDFYQKAYLAFGNYSFSMAIILPKEGTDLNKMLSNVAWAEEEQTRRVFVKLSLPKIQMNSLKNMNEILQDMGVKKIFNDGESLNGIANGLFVSLVQQNSYFCMDESGVEASSTTSAVVRPSANTSPTATMNVNRPFIFIIRENSTGAILFMGKIVTM